MNIVIDSEYFAPCICYLNLGVASHGIIEQYDVYRKMTFRNRCQIAGANGIIDLSIPIIGGREQKALMKSVRIDHSMNWRIRHLKSLESAYNKSPWFANYQSELVNLYQRKMEWLVDWNFACIGWMTDKLSINVELELSGSLIENYPEKEYVDFRRIYTPSTIRKNFPHCNRYPQVFEERHGFIPHLSILDWLFCMGPSLRF